MSDPFFTTYSAFWRRIESEKVCVRYDSPSNRYAEVGYFDHKGGNYENRRAPFGERGPCVAICRLSYPEPLDQPSEYRTDGVAVDLRDEMVTLAHEYGHCLSFRGQTPRKEWDAYFAAASRRDQVVDARRSAGASDVEGDRKALAEALSDAEKALIIREEELAWRLGRSELPKELHPALDQRVAIVLSKQRYSWGIGPQ
ncbi:MAG TPA: hypothetical protein VGG39_23280 [Polyangiaceae bacterium]